MHQRILSFILIWLGPTASLQIVTAADRAQPAITGSYDHGELIPLKVRYRDAYLIKPTGQVDPQKRWVWIAPYWLGISRDGGAVEHRMYVDRLLAAGFHVAGVDVGTSCGSPSGAEVFQEFYELLQKKYQLHPKARLIGQSNGGLIAYAWAFRHAESVDKIAGIYPATDFRTWPKLPNVIAYPEPGLGYNLTLDELTARIPELNPIDNLAPLAKAGVRILHIHGDKDELVPMAENSTELARRHVQLGGKAEIVVIPGLAHGGKVFYENEPFIEFLLAD